MTNAALRRALALSLLAASTAVAQPQTSVAEARVVELANMLRLGRRDSLEAFIARNVRVQGPAEMTVFLNSYQDFFDLAEGARINSR